MEWHQLQYFRAVAQLQHITRAAEQLSLSQPALSRSIAKLEEELGTPLFERQGKRIFLNRPGRVFLDYVERALQEIAEGKQAVQDMLDPDRGEIALAFLHSLGSHFVPGLVGAFRSGYPHVAFKLFQNSAMHLLGLLEAGKIDLLLSSPIVAGTGVEWSPLFTEDLFVIVPRSHPLAGRSHVSLQEIAADPIISFKKEYILRVITDQLFAKVHVTPSITFEGDEIMTVAGLVEAELGVAIIPRISGLDKADIAFLPVAEPLSRRTIGIAWGKNRYLSPAAIKFRDFVIHSFTAR
ncbi:MAG TPA: LysR family transcriptional regulator [Selenomonadales bacterium]|nr:LysR family transcriptional regulator [Selenomonadales bacterium]